MGQKKLIKFAAIKEFRNVLEFPENINGKWSEVFGNNHPITLELACGKGEYTLGLARLYPGQNFIGVDIKGNRIWKGAKTALEEGLNNAAFLRTQIDKIEEYFNPTEIAEIWITFPDPQLRFSKLRKRLTHPKFLRKFQKIASSSVVVNLKTDSPDLYRFTLEVIRFYDLTLCESNDNVYNQGFVNKELQIKTYYESLDIAGQNRVHYIKFMVDKEMPRSKDAAFKDYLAAKENV